jgi:outer membrane protein
MTKVLGKVDNGMNVHGKRIGARRGLRRLAQAAAAATLALAFATTPALAADETPAGKWQVKVLGTAVLPDGKITRVDKDLIGLPAGSQTKASDNSFVPTLAVEYFVLPNLSVETICCFTAHHVSGAGALAGTAIVDHALILPATLTAKYHLTLPGGVQPYVGAGGAWTRTARPAAGDRTDSTAVRYSLGATGFAVRTGVPVGDRPMTTAGGSWSAMAATARWRVDLNARAAGGRQILSIDPRWSESAPALPCSRSLPAAPSIVSSPEFPNRPSEPAVPVTAVSLPAVPTNSSELSGKVDSAAALPDAKPAGKVTDLPLKLEIRVTVARVVAVAGLKITVIRWAVSPAWPNTRLSAAGL